jgi:hypothetical protein
MVMGCKEGNGNGVRGQGGGQGRPLPGASVGGRASQGPRLGEAPVTWCFGRGPRLKRSSRGGGARYLVLRSGAAALWVRAGGRRPLPGASVGGRASKGPRGRLSEGHAQVQAAARPFSARHPALAPSTGASSFARQALRRGASSLRLGASNGDGPEGSVARRVRDRCRLTAAMPGATAREPKGPPRRRAGQAILRCAQNDSVRSE